MDPSFANNIEAICPVLHAASTWRFKYIFVRNHMNNRHSRFRIQALALFIVPFILLALWGSSRMMDSSFALAAGQVEAAEGTNMPPSSTTEPPTSTTEPPTATTEPPTVTPEPPTATPEPTATDLPEGPNCSYTQGFWKNHPEDWPVDSLTIGGVVYTQDEAIDIFETPTRGDATYILIHQLMAATLNVLNGADDAAIAAELVDANDWLAANPLGSRPRNPERSVGIGLSQTLDDYNNGLIGPGHCD